MNPRISRVSGFNRSQRQMVLRSGRKVVTNASLTMVGTESTKRCLKLRGKLLPGIPNEITLNAIITKLSWKDSLILSSVNQLWRHAIRSRQVYNARVLCQSTETLVVFSYQYGESSTIAFYSTKDNLCYDLPPIPGVRLGFPYRAKIVALDGKIYVLGGMPAVSHTSEKVYMFDVVVERKWKECASMEEPKRGKTCHGLDGKIYAVGGWYQPGYPTCLSEMYDPTENIWTPIMPMSSPRHSHGILTMGEELVVHGGVGLRMVKSDFLDVYHTVKKEWRAVDSLSGPSETMFATQGKLYSMSDQGASIHIHRVDGNSWKHLHSFEAFWPRNLYGVLEGWPYKVLVIDDELLALVQCNNGTLTFLQSTGFGKENKYITWQAKGTLPFRYVSDEHHVLQPLQL